MLKLTDLKGLGAKKLKYLNKIGIFTPEDLIFYFPRRYENRKDISTVQQAEDKALLHLHILSDPKVTYVRQRFSFIRVTGRDETGLCEIIYYNMPYIRTKIVKNHSYYFYGKINREKDTIKIVNPIIAGDLNGELGDITPIYPLGEGLTQKDMRKFIKEALSLTEPIDDILPERLSKANHFVSRKEAVRMLHFPKNMGEVSQAKELIKFERLLIFELALALLERDKKEQGIVVPIADKLSETISKLPFKLTEAQNRVLNEVLDDMASDKSMNRLVQGDVGSGKTVIAAMALLNTHFQGLQSAFMAPTEILANQHFESLKSILVDYDVRIELLKGSLSAKEKSRILSELAEGKINIIVGTHALFQDKIEFRNLALVVIDEQHRFGVTQRAKLVHKGAGLNTLIMTATPIPRTLLLVLYNNLKVSTIDQLPPGRQSIETYAVDQRSEKRIIHFLREQIQLGHQIYIVCSLIEQSEKLNVQSIEEIFERLKADFSDVPVAIIHGRLDNEKKDSIMQDFNTGKIKVLFATTVIEVGVNVPNANCMVIYNAERFGLSQLHQLRGRVGRSHIQSYCFLFYNNSSEDAVKRMKIMEKTQDGFVIAQEDLLLRGGGEILGTRQSGSAQLNISEYSSKYISGVISIAHSVVKRDYLNTAEFEMLKKEVMKLKDNFDALVILN